MPQLIAYNANANEFALIRCLEFYDLIKKQRGRKKSEVRDGILQFLLIGNYENDGKMKQKIQQVVVLITRVQFLQRIPLSSFAV